MMIPATNGSFINLLIGFLLLDLFLKNSFVNAVKPKDAKTITAIDPNTSSLTKVELMYTPAIPKSNEKDNISFLIKLEFLFWIFLIINHIPIPEKIIRTEWNINDCDCVVVACSETESVNGSVVVKKGFNALRYLWLADGKNWESELIIKILGAIINNAIKNNKPFLVLFFELLFWTKIQDTKNMVETINEIPPIPKIKLELTRSNPKEIKTVVIV